jgi:hypothetical protein
VRKAALAATKAGEGTAPNTSSGTIPASEALHADGEWEREEDGPAALGEEEEEVTLEMTYSLASTYAKVGVCVCVCVLGGGGG